MAVGGVIAKGASRVGKEYLSKITLALVVALIILVLSLYYYPNPKNQNCSQQTSNTYNEIFQHLGDREIIITNTTSSTNSDCYLTYVCANRTRECPNTCINDGATCSNNTQCCSGCCKNLGTAGSVCLQALQCQPACSQISGLCADDSNCCSGLTCQGRTCQPQVNTTPTETIPVPCLNISGICENSSQCCSGLTCQGRTCQPA